MDKIIDCIIAVSLSALITFLIVGAVLEGEKTTHYNDVIVIGDLK